MRDEGGGMNKKEWKRQHAIDFILLIPHPFVPPPAIAGGTDLDSIKKPPAQISLTQAVRRNFYSSLLTYILSNHNRGKSRSLMRAQVGRGILGKCLSCWT